MLPDDTEILVKSAQTGDSAALQDLVRRIQDPIYHLAMRILVNPEDALDATQEILIVVVTKLSTFQGKSAFRTWLYRVSINYLLTAKKVRDRDPGLTFEVFQEDLHAGIVADAEPRADDAVMLNELRVSCTMAMLLCLDLKHRLAYVLGDILEFDHVEAATVLGLSPDNFRQRLSRARTKVVAFTSQSCGLANKAARCHCPRRLPAAIKLGRVDPNNLTYAGGPSYDTVVDQARAAEGALRVLKLQRATPHFTPPQDLAAKLISIVGGHPPA